MVMDWRASLLIAGAVVAFVLLLLLWDFVKDTLLGIVVLVLWRLATWIGARFGYSPEKPRFLENRPVTREK